MEKIKFFSRKNQVFLVRSEAGIYVEKTFDDRDRFEREVISYEKLKSQKLNVPIRYYVCYKSKTIRYEYIEGELLSFALLNGRIMSFVTMGNYLRAFHNEFLKDEITQLIGDVNLRNFIVQNEIIFPLDYEEYRIGNPMEDVTTFLSHLVSHREVEAKKRIDTGIYFLKSYFRQEDKAYDFLHLKHEIRKKAQRLADYRGLGKLEDEILEIIYQIINIGDEN